MTSRRENRERNEALPSTIQVAQLKQTFKQEQELKVIVNDLTPKIA